LLIAALIAFFAAMLAERGAASSSSNQSTPASSFLPNDDSGTFEPGGIGPAQSQPSTSTGTS